ncbi:hypothetical protein AAMO2058_000247300 [Amorphochlora amoebiformis]|eukprot:793412-Amorphochlora_amoeboformis.AAC.1
MNTVKPSKGEAKAKHKTSGGKPKVDQKRRKAEARLHQQRVAEAVRIVKQSTLEEVKKNPMSRAQIHKLFESFEANQEPKMIDHVKAFLSDKEEYLTHLNMVLTYRVELSTAAKGRILATLFSLGDKAKEAESLLYGYGAYAYGFGEVLKAIELLDTPRRIRQKKAKLDILEAKVSKDEKVVKKKTLSKLKTDIHQLGRDGWMGTSLNGKGIRFFKAYLGSMSKASLEFYLLNFPTAIWKQAFDVLHTNPKELALDYFQGAVYDKKAVPKGSVVDVARQVTLKNIAPTIKKFPELANVYSFIRRSLTDDRPERVVFEKRVRQLTLMGFDEAKAAAVASHFWSKIPENRIDMNDMIDYYYKHQKSATHMRQSIDRREISSETKALLASKMPLSEAIWWYHELASPGAEAALVRRLEAADSDDFSKGAQSTAYGKTMETLLNMREQKVAFAPLLLPHAERKLAEWKLPSSGVRAIVAGDASGSMEVAIKSATILGSLLSLALDANLTFFNDALIKSPCQPRSASDVIKVVENMPAKGSTSMAAALLPFYETKVRIDLFILVSDEGENVPAKGYMFADLWVKYLNEVNPNAQVVLVSFVARNDKGKIKQELEKRGIEARQYRLDPDRPDTSKFDAILGMLTVKCKQIQVSNAPVSVPVKLDLKAQADKKADTKSAKADAKSESKRSDAKPDTKPDAKPKRDTLEPKEVLPDDTTSITKDDSQDWTML